MVFGRKVTQRDRAEVKRYIKVLETRRNKKTTLIRKIRKANKPGHKTQLNKEEWKREQIRGILARNKRMLKRWEKKGEKATIGTHDY